VQAVIDDGELGHWRMRRARSIHWITVQSDLTALPFRTEGAWQDCGAVFIMLRTLNIGIAMRCRPIKHDRLRRQMDGALCQKPGRIAQISVMVA
jgi:hypothetical protein